MMAQVIENSATNGILVKSRAYVFPYGGRAMIVNSTITNSQGDGVHFDDSTGLGRFSHVIVASNVSSNGQHGIYFPFDVAQTVSSAYSLKKLAVWIVGNTIDSNGGDYGGGIRVGANQGLNRAIYIVDNTITSNRGLKNSGAGIYLKLNGVSTRNAGFNAALEAEAIRDGFGTCLIRGNTISGNTAAMYPAMVLTDGKSTSRDTTRNNDRVGYVVEDNEITSNVATSSTTSAVVRIVNEGYFQSNVLTGNTGGAATSAAVSVHTTGGRAYPYILVAHNNTFNNPKCTYELFAASRFEPDEYIDARFSSWGAATTAARVANRVFDCRDDVRKGKIIWRGFLGSAGGRVADPWTNTKVGTIAQDTLLDGTQMPVHIIGALKITGGAVVTVVAGSSVLVDTGVFITINSLARFIAQGNSAEPIVFDTSEQGKTWGGFVFSTASRQVDVATTAPFQVDYSLGSVLEWCVVAHAGSGGRYAGSPCNHHTGTSSACQSSGAVAIYAGGPAILNTNILNSATNGIVVDNSGSLYNARAVILDSMIADSTQSGVVFTGN